LFSSYWPYLQVVRKVKRQERLVRVYKIEKVVLQQWVDMVEKVVLQREMEMVERVWV
jgi:hypothetical protein